MASGDTPLVVSGNCNSCLGTLAAIDRHNCGIVWFDAHGDFNTPETSISGLLDGMALNFATRRFIPESKTALIGVRQLDPGERILLDNSAVLVSPASHFPDKSPRLPDVSRIYLHLDIDVLDRGVSPGVNCQAPGGLSPDVLFTILANLKARYAIAAMALTNYNPEKDEQNRTLDMAIQLIASLI